MFYFSKKNCKGNKSFAVSMLIPRCQCQDFQLAFKMCCINNHNNVAQKLKEMTNIHSSKIESREKHLNKQTVKTLQGLAYVY